MALELTRRIDTGYSCDSPHSVDHITRLEFMSHPPVLVFNNLLSQLV